MSERRLPLPPFSFETAVEKVRKAENAWNTRDPAQVALAYSLDLFGETGLNFWSAARPSSLSSPANGPASSTTG